MLFFSILCWILVAIIYIALAWQKLARPVERAAGGGCIAAVGANMIFFGAIAVLLVGTYYGTTSLHEQFASGTAPDEFLKLVSGFVALCITGVVGLGVAVISGDLSDLELMSARVKVISYILSIVGSIVGIIVSLSM